MVRRLGVGAAAASAFVFSILLASDFLVFSASQDRERLYLQSDEERYLVDAATALMGAGGTNVLFMAQAAFGSGALPCPSAYATAASIAGDLSDVQRSGVITVVTTASFVDGPPYYDNLSVLSPFNGSVRGDVNVLLRMTSSGTDNATGVALSKTEVHHSHLPVRLQRLVEDCGGAADAISSFISKSTPGNCTEAEVGRLMNEAGAEPAAVAGSDGFAFRLGYSYSSGPRCKVDFLVTLIQSGIAGPAGEFSVRAEQGGSASFERPVSAQRA